jgi:hypothetical protein
MSTRVYVFERDKYWLDAISKVKLRDVVLETVHFYESLLNCTGDLPESDSRAPVLIDSFGHQETIDTVIRSLRNRGWQNIDSSLSVKTIDRCFS